MYEHKVILYHLYQSKSIFKVRWNKKWRRTAINFQRILDYNLLSTYVTLKARHRATLHKKIFFEIKGISFKRNEKKSTFIMTQES